MSLPVAILAGGLGKRMRSVAGRAPKALLDKVKVGDKIRFMVTHEDGKMLVTEIQPAS